MVPVELGEEVLVRRVKWGTVNLAVVLVVLVAVASFVATFGRKE
jgi:hypothetical protein